MPDPLAEALADRFRDAYELHLLADMISRGDTAMIDLVDYLIPPRSILVPAFRELLDAGVIEASGDLAAVAG